MEIENSTNQDAPATESFIEDVTEIEPSEVTDDNEVVEEVDSDREAIDNMSAEEVDKLISEEEPAKADNPESDNNNNNNADDLNARYKLQADDADAKLDKPILLKVNGKVFEVDSVNDLKNLAQLGTNSTKKHQQLAENKRELDFMADNNLTIDDLHSLVQNATGQTPVTRTAEMNDMHSVESIATEIENGPNADAFREVASMLPSNIKTQMRSNPGMMKGFSEDVNSGLAQRVMPGVEKLMILKQMDFMTAYASEVQRLHKAPSGTNRPGTNKSVPESLPATKNDAKANMLNSQPSQRAQSSKSEFTREDIDNMSSAELTKYLDEI